MKAVRIHNYGDIDVLTHEDIARAEMIAQRADADHLRSMADLIDAGRIKPVVNSVLPISSIREAQEQVQSGHTRGKIIMKMDADSD